VVCLVLPDLLNRLSPKSFLHKVVFSLVFSFSQAISEQVLNLAKVLLTWLALGLQAAQVFFLAQLIGLETQVAQAVVFWVALHPVIRSLERSVKACNGPKVPEKPLSKSTL
jgi:hypothetical protein